MEDMTTISWFVVLSEFVSINEERATTAAVSGQSFLSFGGGGGGGGLLLGNGSKVVDILVKR